MIICIIANLCCWFRIQSCDLSGCILPSCRCGLLQWLHLHNLSSSSLNPSFLSSLFLVFENYNAKVETSVGKVTLDLWDTAGICMASLSAGRSTRLRLCALNYSRQAKKSMTKSASWHTRKLMVSWSVFRLSGVFGTHDDSCEECTHVARCVIFWFVLVQSDVFCQHQSQGWVFRCYRLDMQHASMHYTLLQANPICMCTCAYSGIKTSASQNQLAPGLFWWGRRRTCGMTRWSRRGWVFEHHSDVVPQRFWRVVTSLMCTIKQLSFVPLLHVQLSQNGEKPVTKKEVHFVNVKTNHPHKPTLHIAMINTETHSDYNQNPIKRTQERHHLAPAGWRSC